MTNTLAFPTVVRGTDADLIHQLLDEIEESANIRCLSWAIGFIPSPGYLNWCRNGRCPRCGRIRGRRRIRGVVHQFAQHQGRIFTFRLGQLPTTAAGDLDWPQLKLDVHKFTRRLRGYRQPGPLPGLEFVWRVQRNPAGTGFHLHGVGYSDRTLAGKTVATLTGIIAEAWGKGHAQHARPMSSSSRDYRFQKTNQYDGPYRPPPYLPERMIWAAAMYLEHDYFSDDDETFEDSCDLNNDWLLHGTDGIDKDIERPFTDAQFQAILTRTIAEIPFPDPADHTFISNRSGFATHAPGPPSPPSPPLPPPAPAAHPEPDEPDDFSGVAAAIAALIAPDV